MLISLETGAGPSALDWDLRYGAHFWFNSRVFPEGGWRMSICKYVGPGYKFHIKQGVAAQQEDADVFTADALTADTADVLSADAAGG